MPHAYSRNKSKIDMAPVSSYFSVFLRIDEIMNLNEGQRNGQWNDQKSGFVADAI